MNTPTLPKTVRTTFIAFGLSAVELTASGANASASNMEKVDIVKEGIDLDPIYVNANSNGYTGSENKAHKYMVRVFAKAKGQNRVWKVVIYGVNTAKLFEKDVGRSDGWPVYGKSHEIYAKPSSMGWVTTPGTACKNLLSQKMANGMKKSDVLKSDHKTTALALVGFGAYADSKANNRKNDHGMWAGSDAHHDNVAYQVQVVCRAAL